MDGFGDVELQRPRLIEQPAGVPQVQVAGLVLAELAKSRHAGVVAGVLFRHVA